MCHSGGCILLGFAGSAKSNWNITVNNYTGLLEMIRNYDAGGKTMKNTTVSEEDYA